MRHGWERLASTLAGTVLLTGAAACVDLNVRNPNAPDVERVGIEALLSGIFRSWQAEDGGLLISEHPSAMSFQHSQISNTFGTIFPSQIPRVAILNRPEAQWWHWQPGEYAWDRRYAAIATVRSVLLELGDEGHLRERAYAKFMQGMAHGSVALVFDSAYVYDETMEPDEPMMLGYGAVMEAALGYLEEAATLAQSGTFTVPAAWMSQEVTSGELARLAYAWRARFRASVPRTPPEREAVDWVAVVEDVGRGINEDWSIICDDVWDRPGVAFTDVTAFWVWATGQMSYWVLGMADTSGAYQAWMAAPLLEKMPFLMITPDLRFPQGTDEAEQTANPGAYYTVYKWWLVPERGTWRWSYYWNTTWDEWASGGGGPAPLVTVREMRLLLAEAAYWAGDHATTASIVNETRTLYGLNATDAQGTNTSCVPRLPDGSCGDLWEMFKWEKRVETWLVGPDRMGWWFDGRGWGDLMEGSYLQWPIPWKEQGLREAPRYDVGGVGGLYAAPVGTYGY